jgi:hypothetical protein
MMGAQFPFFYYHSGGLSAFQRKIRTIYPGNDALSEGNSRYPAFYPR